MEFYTILYLSNFHLWKDLVVQTVTLYINGISLHSTSFHWNMKRAEIVWVLHIKGSMFVIVKPTNQILLQNTPFLLCVSLLYLVYSSFWCMALKLMQLLNDIHNSNPFSFSLCENLLTFHFITFCYITLDEIKFKLVFSWWTEK